MSDHKLTRYDDYPIHQAPHPVSHIPVTDPAWDEGYYFGVLQPDDGIFLITGMRISPNSDVIGAHAGLNLKGVQRTLRMSREWRVNCDTELGPYKVDFVEPFKDIRLTLGDNPSNLRFDVHWLGLAPAADPTHHVATNRGRRTTDQTRYNQVGVAEGWIEIDGRRIEVTPDRWLAVRDHSWGVYEGRPPLGGHSKWLPPADVPAVRRALRFSQFFQAEDLCGHLHIHEDEDGRQVLMNDAFGVPFEGVIDQGWDKRLPLASGHHLLKFAPGTRSLTEGELALTDRDGGQWTISFDVSAPPHVIVPVGYHLGSWKDGGNIHTWHGAHDPYMEWDEFDFSRQPTQHTLYGETEPRAVYGVEHIGHLTLTGPDGRVRKGKHQTEVFLNGRFAPYGFEAPVASKHGLTGRGIL